MALKISNPGCICSVLYTSFPILNYIIWQRWRVFVDIIKNLISWLNSKGDYCLWAWLNQMMLLKECLKVNSNSRGALLLALKQTAILQRGSPIRKRPAESRGWGLSLRTIGTEFCQKPVSLEETPAPNDIALADIFSNLKTPRKGPSYAMPGLLTHGNR